MSWDFAAAVEESSDDESSPVAYEGPWGFGGTSSVARQPESSDDDSSGPVVYEGPWGQDGARLGSVVAAPAPSEDSLLNLQPALDIEWVRFIISQCQGRRRLRPRIARRLMRMGGSFAGLLPEIPAVDSMGVPADFCETSELLPDVREAAQLLHGNRYRKTFHRAEEHMAAVDSHDVGILGCYKQLDLGLLSPACQPWSLLRERSGPSGRTCDRPEDHPWWTQTFHLVPGWIAKVGPAGVLVEQVWQGFATDTETDNGEPDALTFFKVLIALFPSGGVAYVRLQLSAWTKGFSRSRTAYMYTYTHAMSHAHTYIHTYIRLYGKQR